MQRYFVATLLLILCYPCKGRCAPLAHTDQAKNMDTTYRFPSLLFAIWLVPAHNLGLQWLNGKMLVHLCLLSLCFSGFHNWKGRQASTDEMGTWFSVQYPLCRDLKASRNTNMIYAFIGPFTWLFVYDVLHVFRPCQNTIRVRTTRPSLGLHW